jgi:lipid II:glycine glycyltransferase (peptidoglycan interpeptide bridge formation enzyme)
LKIIEVNQEENKKLEEFLILKKAALFQFYNWGKFQESLGRKIWQLIFLTNENIIASALIIKYELPLGKSYLYCNRGPILSAVTNELRIQILKLLIEKISEIAQKENSIFFRLDPEWDNKVENTKLFSNLNFKKSKKETNPKNTLILNISKSEEEILTQMHSKTRYNIRLSEKKGVTVRISNKKNDDFEAFWQLMEETAKRDGFRSHVKDYYKKQLNFFDEKGLIKLLVAEYEGIIISAIIVSFCGKQATYLHGASSYEHRKYMAPHLI